jgi:hypothetical protein
MHDKYSIPNCHVRNGLDPGASAAASAGGRQAENIGNRFFCLQPTFCYATESGAPGLPLFLPTFSIHQK